MKKLFVATAALAGLSAQAMAADIHPRVAAMPVAYPPPMMPAAPAPVAYPPMPTSVAVPVAPYAAPLAVPLFTWTGFYAGVNAGYSFTKAESGRLTTPNPGGKDYPVIPAAGSTFRTPGENGGLLGGAQAGYNIQFGSVVAGVEADMQAIDLPRKGSTLSSGVRVARLRGTVLIPEFDEGEEPVEPVMPIQPAGVTLSNIAAGNVYLRPTSNEVDLFGTVRGRVGVAFDRLLVYGTGGFAWKTNEDGGDGGRPPSAFYSPFSPGAAARGKRVVAQLNEGSTTDMGWALGAGMEYAFAHNLSARIEGLYVNLGNDGKKRVVGVTNTGEPIVAANSEKSDFALVRAGLNYRFGTF
jgi:outer membrane immunogenic protein